MLEMYIEQRAVLRANEHWSDLKIESHWPPLIDRLSLVQDIIGEKLRQIRDPHQNLSLVGEFGGNHEKLDFGRKIGQMYDHEKLTRIFLSGISFQVSL